jgi:hypothetical protein
MEKALGGTFGFGFSEIFKRHPQHAKAFAFFFSNMFMMNLMCSSDSPEIRIVRVSQDLKALMYKDIMYKKIRHPIKGNP